MAQAEMARSKSEILYQSLQDKSNVELQDFNIKALIGEGGFGKVYMVQKIDTKAVYAMKAIRKEDLIRTKQIESTLLEKSILEHANHPFIVTTEFVIATEYKIYFIMQLVRGGELFNQLKIHQRFTETRARFYVAQIALALGHLHKKKIVYRDLKPENVLLDGDGYVKLADFGLAKYLDERARARSFCGTREYMAPEMIKKEGHAFALDWWTLGIMAYEMVIGFPPFISKDPSRKKQAELILRRQVYYPTYEQHGIAMTEECKDFITQCLQKDEKARLGFKNDLDEIMNHPWLQPVNQ